MTPPPTTTLARFEPVTYTADDGRTFTYGPVVVDIGAGPGWWLLEAHAAGAAELHAYEPNPAHHAALDAASKATDGALRVWPYAVSDTPAVVLEADGRVRRLATRADAEAAQAAGATLADAALLDSVLRAHIPGDFTYWSPPFTEEEEAARVLALVTAGDWTDPLTERTLTTVRPKLAALRLGLAHPVLVLAEADPWLLRRVRRIYLEHPGDPADLARILEPLGFEPYSAGEWRLP